MNRRPDAPDPLSPEERDLADRLLRLGPNDGPSAALDAKILAAAHAAVAQTPRPRARDSRRWPAWIGIAATLALAVGIGWQLRPVDKAPDAISEEAAAAGSADAAADVAAAAGAASDGVASDSAADSAAAAEAPADAAARVAAPAMAPPPPPKLLVPEPVMEQAPAPAQDLSAQSRHLSREASPPARAQADAAAEPRGDADAGTARDRVQSYSRSAQPEDARAVPAPILPPPPPPPPQPMIAPTPAAAIAAPAPAARDAYKRDTAAKSIHNAPPLPQSNARRAEGEAAVGSQQGLSGAADAPGAREFRESAPAESKAAASQAAPAAAAAENAKPEAPHLDAITVTGSRISGGYQDDNSLSAEEWLDRIRSYRDSDQTERARESLREFRRSHPRHRIPEDLRPLLK